MQGTLAAALGGLAVALGAFGAHGLKGKLEGLPHQAARLEWWQTAAHYHLIHAVALFGIAAVASRLEPRWANGAYWLMLGGTLVFSGTLYTMTLTGIRWLGAVTPLGGTALILGWAALAIACWRQA